MNNILLTIEQEVLLSDTNENIINVSSKLLEGTDRIYSYLVYNIYKNNCLYCWHIKYMVSETDKYNTIEVKEAILSIINIINNCDITLHKRVAGYQQPPIELIFELYDPLITKLAYKQSNKWKSLDLDDAYQMCRLVILTLYRKGYYLHKRLIEKSYNNYVLLQLRKEKDIPPIVSLNDVLSNNLSSDNETLFYVDVIADIDTIDAEKERYNREVRLDIFNELKKEIIDIIGERRYEQLLNDYSKKHTSSSTQRLLYVLKGKLNKLGITKEALYKKYYG